MQRRARAAAVVTVAALALAAAAATGATAGSLITSRQILDGTITGVDVKNNSLTGTDVKDRTIGAGDLRDSTRATLVEWVSLIPDNAGTGSFTGAYVRATSPGMSNQVLGAVRPTGAPVGVFCVYFTNSALNGLDMEGVSVSVQRSSNVPGFATATTVFGHDRCAGTGNLLDPPVTQSFDVAVDTFAYSNGAVSATDMAFVLHLPRR
jgi:hypothetical protein